MLEIFKIKIDDLSLEEALTKIRGFLTDGKQHLIVTANPEILLQAKADSDYHQILARADLKLADGFGLVLLGYLFSKPLKNSRVTGVDLIQALARDSKKYSYSLFFTGFSDFILQKTTHNLSIKYGKINISGVKIGPVFDKYSKFPFQDNTNDELINEINKKQPDILLVGFGAPKQEKWIDCYLPQLKSVKVAIGVGGVFDYLSGNILRAPEFFRKIGLEWLWRLIRQPQRLIRIIKAVIVFPVLAIIDKFKNVPRGTF